MKEKIVHMLVIIINDTWQAGIYNSLDTLSPETGSDNCCELKSEQRRGGRGGGAKSGNFAVLRERRWNRQNLLINFAAFRPRLSAYDAEADREISLSSNLLVIRWNN